MIPKLFTLFLPLFITAHLAFGQQFEGVITYTLEYVSTNVQTRVADLEQLYGTVQEYYIKGGNYKKVYKYNERTVVTQVFRADEMKMYQRMPAIPEVLIWDDYRRVSDTLLSYRLEPDYDWYMEDSLDLLTIESKRGVNHFLLSDTYRIDPQLYREHNFGLSNEQLRVAGGRLPLQLVLNYPDYRVMLSAVSVQEQALADDLFRITPPADLVPAEALLEKKPDALTKGYPALYRHLQRTLKYPREARRKGTEGRVFFAFVTDEQGRISHLGKLKGIGSGCDEEAERAIRTFPGFWEPGQINGRNVKVFYLLPVVFRLN